jgi:hypothetical protein
MAVSPSLARRTPGEYQALSADTPTHLDGLLGLLVEGEHVAHTQDALSHALRVEGFKRIHLLTNTHKLDGLARNLRQKEGQLIE